MKETAAKVASSEAAPAGERYEAQAERTDAVMDQMRHNLIPAERIAPLLEFIAEQNANQEFAKSLRANNVIQFPSYAARKREPGMQSVYLDDVQIGVMGEYYERPGVFSFESMRQMVAGTPILNAVIMQRIRQVQRFCRPQRDGKGPGFKIRPRDKDAHVGDDQKKVILTLESFFSNCGFEKNPRQRARLKRDNFSSFMAKLVRDTLTMDSAPIETEYKRDKKLGIDGMYAVDGATLRLCTEQGYKGDDEIFALQIVQGSIRSAYTYDDLIYVPRNPQTSVLSGGYGMSETELLIQTVTGFLNAVSYNTKFFDSNALPKGILNLYGNYSTEDINSFKRNWNAMVKGINNSWALPVMVSKDAESAAKYETFGEGANEMMFAKWMTFLGSLICAIFGMSPEEINMESFSAGTTSSLSGDDTEEQISSSKDKGLRPLLAHHENLFTDYIVSDFTEDLEFAWTGLDEEDAKTVLERKKLTMTVNEMRAEDGRDAVTETWGDAPLNPTLVAAWQQEAMPQEEDFGQPGMSPDAPGAAGGDEDGAQPGGDDEEDFGSPGGENDTGADFGTPDAGGGPAQPSAFGKSFGLPLLRIEP